MDSQVHKLYGKSQVAVEYTNFQKLFDVLSKMGYTIVGPTIRDSAIVYDRITSVSDLPIGWTDEQDSGSYRLKKRQDNALFGYVVGPHSWKKFLFPPVTRLWQAKLTDNNNFQIIEEEKEHSKYAFLGVRSCEINAIFIQDKVFLNGKYVDKIYKSIRENSFIIAVNCTQAGRTCFCVSMNAGPKVQFGFDIALTEIIENDSHYFIIEIDTELGMQVMSGVPHRNITEKEIKIALGIVNKTAKRMGRTMDTTNIKKLLYNNYEHPQWDNIANRCLSCANCTMVCPTCFCSTVEDVTDLEGSSSERVRKWDSCFSTSFSYIHGGSIRVSTKSRYRQWMIHKLATWIDQFGTSGCVGCGRCITWCPVGIDITKEIDMIRKNSREEVK